MTEYEKALAFAKRAIEGNYGHEPDVDIVRLAKHFIKADEARLDLIERLSRAAQSYFHRYNGKGGVTKIKTCRLCDEEWEDGTTEKHTANCILNAALE